MYKTQPVKIHVSDLSIDQLSVSPQNNSKICVNPLGEATVYNY